MARRIMNRKELRADYDAAERRNPDNEQDELEDTDADPDDEGEGDGETDELAAGGDGEDQDDEAPRKRKPAGKGTRTRSRARSAKVARLKVVWAVFNNANQRVAVFDYAKRKEADDLAAQLRADKNMTHFVQPVKEPMEE